jgi:hypothetical protein
VPAFVGFDILQLVLMHVSQVIPREGVTACELPEDRSVSFGLLLEHWIHLWTSINIVDKLPALVTIDPSLPVLGMRFTDSS